MTTDCPQLKSKTGELNIKSRADISLLESGERAPYHPVDTQKIFKILGTSRSSHTLKKAVVELRRLKNVVQTDTINAQKRCVIEANQSLTLGEGNLPHEPVENFEVIPRNITIDACDRSINVVPQTDSYSILFSKNVNTGQKLMKPLESKIITTQSLVRADEDGSADSPSENFEFKGKDGFYSYLVESSDAEKNIYTRSSVEFDQFAERLRKTRTMHELDTSIAKDIEAEDKKSPDALKANAVDGKAESQARNAELLRKVVPRRGVTKDTPLASVYKFKTIIANETYSRPKNAVIDKDFTGIPVNHDQNIVGSTEHSVIISGNVRRRPYVRQQQHIKPRVKMKRKIELEKRKSGGYIVAKARPPREKPPWLDT